MPVVPDHHIVPVRDKEESASFLARILGLPYAGAKGAFASVHVGETILDFSTRQPVPRLHYAFKVSEDEFDGVVERLQTEGVPYGSEHDGTYNGKTNERAGSLRAALVGRLCTAGNRPSARPRPMRTPFGSSRGPGCRSGRWANRKCASCGYRGTGHRNLD